MKCYEGNLSVLRGTFEGQDLLHILSSFGKEFYLNALTLSLG